MPSKTKHYSLIRNSLYISMFLFLISIGGIRLGKAQPGTATNIGFVSLGEYQFPDQHPPTGIVVEGYYAYISYNDARFEGWGLRILDVFDPQNITLVGSYDIPHNTGDTGQVRDLALQGNLVFLAAGGQGMRVVDVTDPTNPTQIGVYPTPANGYIYDVSAIDQYAYLASGDAGIRVVNVSDPSNPQEDMVIPISSSSLIQTTNSRIYSDDFDENIQVFDRNTGAFLGKYERPINYFTGINDIKVEGNDIYFTDAGCFKYVCNSSINLVDFTNPVTPTLTHTYNPGNNQVFSSFNQVGDLIFAGVLVNDPLSHLGSLKALQVNSQGFSQVGQYPFYNTAMYSTAFDMTIVGDHIYITINIGEVDVFRYLDLPYANYLPVIIE